MLLKLNEIEYSFSQKFNVITVKVQQMISKNCKLINLVRLQVVDWQLKAIKHSIKVFN